MNLGRFAPDPFTVALLAVLVLGALLPASGGAADTLGLIGDIAIGLLFFLHGARLQRAVVIAGIRHWRLHAFILATSFVVFPLLGLLISVSLPESVVPAALTTGLLFLCLLPSTVQSSIAFTSMAGGNVVAAICAATASNLVGMFLTPFGVSLFMDQEAGFSFATVGPIVFQLLLPFIAGQIAQPWIGALIRQRARVLSFFDRGAILLVVYLAFSAAVVAGLWDDISLLSLVVVVVVCIALLAAVMTFTMFGSRFLGFSRADEIAIVFCGSLKSLVSGIPIANVLFTGADLGFIVLPLMLFHQIQLITCAIVARRYARAVVPPAAT